MRATLISVNLAVPRTLRYRGREVPTGIFKKPVQGPVRLGLLSLNGDLQADRRVHGGAGKAAYVYPLEHYSHWRTELAREDLTPGFFGENFTTSGLLESSVRIGDVFRIGTAAVQVTAPRSPCFKLGLKVGEPHFVESFLESGRLGFYLSVVAEGNVAAGDSIERLSTDPSAPSVSQFIAARYGV